VAKPVGWEAGTEVKLTYESDWPWVEGAMPVEGDLLASHAGAAYVIEDAKLVRGNPRKIKLICARLEYGSICPDDAEVWPLYWTGRR
jgi:hypothetical protein